MLECRVKRLSHCEQLHFGVVSIYLKHYIRSFIEKEICKARKNRINTIGALYISVYSWRWGFPAYQLCTSAEHPNHSPPLTLTLIHPQPKIILIIIAGFHTGFFWGWFGGGGGGFGTKKKN